MLNGKFNIRFEKVGYVGGYDINRSVEFLRVINIHPITDFYKKQKIRLTSKDITTLYRYLKPKEEEDLLKNEKQEISVGIAVEKVSYTDYNNEQPLEFIRVKNGRSDRQYIDLTQEEQEVVYEFIKQEVKQIIAQRKEATNEK